MAKFKGTTIAFSHRERVWKTRYSFTPTCYASVDNYFISCNKADANTSCPAWIHTTTAANKNEFHLDPSFTSFSVVSNYNPSSFKQFKSISLEGQNFPQENAASFLIESNTSRITTTDERKLIDGAVYSDILFDSSGISAANLSYCFSYDPSTLSLIQAINEAGNAANSDGETSNEIVFEFGPVTQIGPYQLGDNHLVGFLDADTGYIREVKETKRVFAMSGDQYGDDIALSMESYNPVSKKIKFRYVFTFEWNELITASGGGTISAQDYITESGYIVQRMERKTQGDPITGNYCTISATLNSNDQEVFAINVNYEPTKLDHSLGQNV